MSPFDESALRTALHERSQVPSVPGVPVDVLLQGGRRTVRTRRTRWVAGVGVAAAAFVVAGALTLPADESRPPGPASPTPTAPTQRLRTLAELPRGDLPSVPFAEGGTLYTGGIATDVEDGRLSRIARGYDAGTDTWTVATAREQAGASSLDLLDPATGDKATHITDGVGNPVVVSADGALVAWEDDNADGTARVRLWDVGSRTAAGTVSFPFTPTCCDNPFGLEGVDAEGRVYGFGGSTSWVAVVGGEAREITGIGDGSSIVEVGASLLVVDDQGSERVGRVGADGRFDELFSVSGQHGATSWDEARFAYAGRGGVRVREVGSNLERTIAMPADVDVVGGLTWETSTELLVQVQAATGEAGGNAWVRCWVETGECELATTFPDELPTVPDR